MTSIENPDSLLQRRGSSMKTSRLILPLPPSDNHARQLIGNTETTEYTVQNHQVIATTRHSAPRSIRTAAAREYISEVQWLTKAWIHQTGWEIPERHTKIWLIHWIYWPDARTHDPANLYKVLHDALKGILVVDDNTILPWAMDFTIDRQHPRIECRPRLRFRANPRQSSRSISADPLSS